MLWEKIRWFWKNGLVNRNKAYKKILFCSIAGIIVCISSCSNTSSQKDNQQQLCGEEAKKATSKENKNSEEKKQEQVEKGYNLQVPDKERKEAKEDCKSVMESILDIYKQADKGQASNIVISDETIDKMVEKVKETGYPVTATKVYTNMENHQVMEGFLKACKNGKKGSMILYEIHSDGGIGRYKYIFDGTNIYVLSAIAIWNQNDEPKMTEVSYTRIKKWKYTKKGWFGYELCVPEPPEVSEMVDGTVTLIVDAVCDMVVCDEAMITHELIVRFAKDGSFKFLGNKILDGRENIS